MERVSGAEMNRKPVERKKVVLTEGQRERLESLWFVYGNHGPKTTPDNHGFIQGFLERDSGERDFYKPTAECLAAVDAVLAREGAR
jgi:hypothetical protein